MRTIPDYIQAIDNVLSGLEREQKDIVERNKPEILGLNKEQLYEYGVDSDGKSLRKYRPNTVKIKAEKGQIFQYTTLFDSGDFYGGFDLLFRSNQSISIFSRDYKSVDLQEKYGNNIFGLMKGNQQVLNYDIIKPELDKFLMKYL